MIRPRNKKTAESAIGSMFGDSKTNSACPSGLDTKVTRYGMRCASQNNVLRYCHAVLCRATINTLGQTIKGGGRIPLVSSRRLIATSRFARGVSFGVNRCHGLIAPSLFMGAIRPQFLTGSRAGGLTAYRFLERGISYPARLALPVGKGRQFTQLVQGALAMMLTPTRSVSTAFPTVPEPVFKPVFTRNIEASNYDVQKDLDAIFLCCENELHSAQREPSLTKRSNRLNVLRSVIENVVSYCNESLGITREPNGVMEA